MTETPGGASASSFALASEAAALYSNALPAARSGPLYNAFSYPTKISPETIAVLIATHTRPGDTVLDTFAGSGTTGIAALLCDRPTPMMLKIAAGLGAVCLLAWTVAGLSGGRDTIGG